MIEQGEINIKEIVLCDGGNCDKMAILCQKYGLAVNVDRFSETDICEDYANEINHNLSRYQGIKIASMHGPYKDLCMGSKDKLIRNVTMERFEYAYIIAKQLRCSNLVLHHGYVPGTSNPRNWVERASSFLRDFLCDKDENLCIHIENQFEKTPDLLLEVILKVNNDRLGICLDVGHINCSSQIPVVKWIEFLGDKISFVHLHNNNSEEDQHLEFENGTLDFCEICSALEINCPSTIWGIETRNIVDLEKSVRWLGTQGYVKL